ncbi:PP2C family protein-serine/threonine phosphatase [Microbacterium sp. gxy059]|uniref:PP2C family protein-serine/threonine phosphatase n=1 Tax=Microbacterium sp. gxy059 TaxID=2957199 RepID=UPI003D96495E
MTQPAIVTAAGAATDVGRRRTVNEDAALASAPCFLVADGMGGHDAGDVAAATALGAFSGFAGRGAVSPEEVRDALAQARRVIDRFSETQQSGAGCTLTGVIAGQQEDVGYWLVVNVGDSRTYLLRSGRLAQLTVDHSLVQELVDAAGITLEEARARVGGHVVTRALGAGNPGAAELWMLPALPGDRVLVCSDGLSDELDADAIAEVLRGEDEPQRAATRLVDAAVHAGGRDNVTAVVVDALEVRGCGEGADIEVQTLERDSWRVVEIDADTLPRRSETDA